MLEEKPGLNLVHVLAWALRLFPKHVLEKCTLNLPCATRKLAAPVCVIQLAPVAICSDAARHFNPTVPSKKFSKRQRFTTQHHPTGNAWQMLD